VVVFGCIVASHIVGDRASLYDDLSWVLVTTISLPAFTFVLVFMAALLPNLVRLRFRIGLNPLFVSPPLYRQLLDSVSGLQVRLGLHGYSPLIELCCFPGCISQNSL